MADAAKRSGQSLSDWARRHLLGLANHEVPMPVPTPAALEKKRRLAQTTLVTTKADIKKDLRLEA
jgi:hypothetical protein